MHTPWGPAQTIIQLGEGIPQVTTASHGGIRLSPARNGSIPQVWRTADGWYEEDDEWAAVAISFPGAFPEPHVRYAHFIAAYYRADTYITLYGKAEHARVLAGETQTRAAILAHQHDRQSPDTSSSPAANSGAGPPRCE